MTPDSPHGIPLPCPACHVTPIHKAGSWYRFHHLESCWLSRLVKQDIGGREADIENTTAWNRLVNMYNIALDNHK